MTLSGVMNVTIISNSSPGGYSGLEYVNLDSPGGGANGDAILVVVVVVSVVSGVGSLRKWLGRPGDSGGGVEVIIMGEVITSGILMDVATDGVEEDNDDVQTCNTS